MNKYILPALAALITSTILSGCIREDIPDCVGLTVTLSVKDKNYINVDEVDEIAAVDEGLSFGSYVPTLYCTLRDAVTGEIVEEQQFDNISVDDDNFVVKFCDCHPYGQYIVTVWGGYDDVNQISLDGNTIEMHPDGGLGGDIYACTQTVTFSPTSYTCDMRLERLMGRLVVIKEWTNDQPRVNSSVKTITNLYSIGAADASYDVPATVTLHNTWQTATRNVSSFALAPTAVPNKSTLSIQLPDTAISDDIVLNPDPVDVTIKRNQITVVKYTWNDDDSHYVISMLVDGQWRNIESLRVD